MHWIFGGLLCSLLLVSPSWCQEPELPVESQRHEGVPTGKIEGPFKWRSEIYPGTDRDYWLYIPAQYDAQKSACVLVVQDGLGRANDWRLPIVMDNLIHQGEMPVTIGIFIDHGKVMPLSEGAQPRFNRSFEYDALGDRYARFLLEEILPEVGKSFNLSDDPNDRAIGGASSGAICAFTVAWERPDEFRRVLSTIGTYVGLRGGNIYPTLIRKTEPKPIRVFLQDGRNDLDIYGGDWFTANLDMLSALQFSRYDVNHAWGDGGHNGKHARQIMPDALRWLWRDYPQPIQANVDSSNRRTKLLLQGEDWQQVSEGHRFTEGPVVADDGTLYFTDIPTGKVFRQTPEGEAEAFAVGCPGVNGLAFDAEGTLYACVNGSREIRKFASDGQATTWLADIHSNDIVWMEHGAYVTDPTHQKIWFVDQAGKRVSVDVGIAFPNGVAASADQSLLYVSDSHGRFIYSFQIQDDGRLAHRQEYGYLHLADHGGHSAADGMAVDTTGRLYVATQLGIQVLDPLGRVHFILSPPQPGPVSNVAFGGKDRDWLYVTCGDKVFRRRLSTQGAVAWQPPVEQPRPGL